jgi:DNA-repair protein XRCC1
MHVFVADCVCLVKFNQDIGGVTEDWKFLPRVVEELAKLDVVGNNKPSMSKEDIHKLALDCKCIYEEELNRLDHESTKKSKINEEHRSKNGRTNAASSSGAVDYDSDDTIEMTEQEIDLAYKTLSSKMCHL